jgi:hypothetical protein
MKTRSENEREKPPYGLPWPGYLLQIGIEPRDVESEKPRAAPATAIDYARNER